MRRLIAFALATASALLLQLPSKAATPEGKGFPSADAAAHALVSAAANDDVAGLIEILGPLANNLIATRGPVADQKVRRDFAARAAQKMRLVPRQGRRDARTLLTGNDEWPLPIPILEVKSQWYFDTFSASK